MPPFQFPCLGAELFLHQCSLLRTVLEKNYPDLHWELGAKRCLWPQLTPWGDKKYVFLYWVRLSYNIGGFFWSCSSSRKPGFGCSIQLFLLPQLQEKCCVGHWFGKPRLESETRHQHRQLGIVARWVWKTGISCNSKEVLTNNLVICGNWLYYFLNLYMVQSAKNYIVHRLFL